MSRRQIAKDCSNRNTAAKSRSATESCKSALLFKPLAWLLRLSAMMYNTDLLCDPGICSCRSKVISTAKPRRGLTKWSRVAYMVVVHSLTWSNVIKLLCCLDTLTVSLDDVRSQIQVILLLLATMSVFSMTATAIAFSTRLPKLPQKICSIQRKYGVTKEWSFKKVSKVGICGLLMTVVAAVFLGVGFLLLTCIRRLLKHYFVIITCPFQIGYSSFWNATLVLWFGNSMAISVSCLFICLSIYLWFCRMISYLFDQCSIGLRQFNSSCGFEKTQVLKRAVEFHGDVCELICLGNDLFKAFVFSVYCMAIPSICFNLNATFKEDHDSDEFINAVFDEVFMASLLMLVIISASLVNSKAVQILGEFCQLSLKEATQKELQMAAFFTTKLTGRSVGLTMADMLVIDKGHILTLLGILLTYTVLIVQFDSPGTNHVMHNITTA